MRERQHLSRSSWSTRTAIIAAVALLLISTLAAVRWSLAPGIAARSQGFPTSFGDRDDLPASAYHPVGSLPHGTATVSGTVTDAQTGQPVANATVGISLGTSGSGASYATTDSNGNYSFTGIATGTYNLSAWRYDLSQGEKTMYQDSQKMQVSISGNTTINFALTPLPVPGSRTIGNNAKNFILVDYDETYYEAWFTDTKSMANKSPSIHSVASNGVVATTDYTQYGWSPIDHYQLAVGGFPAWRTPDDPPPVWGQNSNMDTNLWYNTSEVFGQESIFDVAKSYGMSTAVIGGDDYPTGHITDSNVDTIELGPNINGVPTKWVQEVENFMTAHANNPNGMLIYMPVTEAEGFSPEDVSPDSSTGAYQQDSTWDDEALGELLTWLQQNGYMANTDIAVTADEAQNDHTSFDNFYGLGSTGMGTTRHIPFTMEGPNVVTGGVQYTQQMGIDDEPTNIMYALGLPAPVDSRGHVIPAFFTTHNPTPTPTPTPSGTPTPTPTPSGTPTPTPTNTPTPTPTSTPGGGNNLIIDGGFETQSPAWVLKGSPLPQYSTANPHTGNYSMLVGGLSNQKGVSYFYQVVTIPSNITSATLSYWYWPSTTDTPQYAYQAVGIYSTSGKLLAQVMKVTSNDQKWENVTFDMSQFAGQTVAIAFIDSESSGTNYYNCYMYVDDVSLNVS